MRIAWYLMELLRVGVGVRISVNGPVNSPYSPSNSIKVIEEYQ